MRFTSSNRTLVGVTAAVVALLGAAASAAAGFIDFDPKTPERETASWPEPSVIKVYIPAELAGDDRMNFEMGIQIWAACLQNIMIMFADGDRPGNTGVDVDLCPPGSITETLPDGSTVRRFGLTTPEAFFPDGQTHGMITGAVLKIDRDALGNATFLKNLGAHEFGHALGLDEDPRAAGAERTTVMDPDFDRASPFVGLSARDKMMLAERYTLVPEGPPENGIPEPSAFVLAVAGLLGGAALQRFTRRGRGG